jgi:hypothetical protein
MSLKTVDDVLSLVFTNSDYKSCDNYIFPSTFTIQQTIKQNMVKKYSFYQMMPARWCPVQQHIKNGQLDSMPFLQNILHIS